MACLLPTIRMVTAMQRTHISARIWHLASMHDDNGNFNIVTDSSVFMCVVLSGWNEHVWCVVPCAADSPATSHRLIELRRIDVFQRYLGVIEVPAVVASAALL